MATIDLSDYDDMGPVDFLVLEFPKFTMTGEGLAELVALVDKGLIRVLDLLFVRKDEEGVVTAVAVTDLDGDGVLDLAVFEGAASGLLGEDDVDEAAQALAPGSAGGILVYENLWAMPMARALRRNGAQLVASGRIPVQALIASAEAMESADA